MVDKKGAKKSLNNNEMTKINELREALMVLQEKCDLVVNNLNSLENDSRKNELSSSPLFKFLHKDLYELRGLAAEVSPTLLKRNRLNPVLRISKKFV